VKTGRQHIGSKADRQTERQTDIHTPHNNLNNNNIIIIQINEALCEADALTR